MLNEGFFHMVYLFSGKVYKNLVNMPTVCSPERRPVSEDLTVFLKVSVIWILIFVKFGKTQNYSLPMCCALNPKVWLDFYILKKGVLFR